VKPVGQNADDGVRLAIQLDVSTDDGGVGRHLRLPEAEVSSATRSRPGLSSSR
jgi:hypothetical protein